MYFSSRSPQIVLLAAFCICHKIQNKSTGDFPKFLDFFEETWRTYFPAQETAVMAVTAEQTAKGLETITHRPEQGCTEINTPGRKGEVVTQMYSWTSHLHMDAPQRQHGRNILSNPSQPVVAGLIFGSHSADLKYLLSFIICSDQPQDLSYFTLLTHTVVGANQFHAPWLNYLSFYKYYCTFHWSSLLTIWTK